jgi:hypothetical protein
MRLAVAETDGSSKLTGVWRGQMNGLPALAMVVTDEGGELSGVKRR